MTAAEFIPVANWYDPSYLRANHASVCARAEQHRFRLQCALHELDEAEEPAVEAAFHRPMNKIWDMVTGSQRGEALYAPGYACTNWSFQ